MKNKVITYRNRIEVKMILVAYAFIFIPLFLFILISDLIQKSEHLLQNLGGFCLFFAVALIPVPVIYRYCIRFDFEDKTVTYVHYFKRKKIIPMDDMKVKYGKPKSGRLSNEFSFYLQDKKVFKISEIDFEGQTKQSSDCLKRLFTGTEKTIYDWERKYKERGLFVTFYCYSLSENIGFILIDEKESFFTYISLGYITEKELLDIKVLKATRIDFQEELFEEIQVPIEDLEPRCDDLIERYKDTA